MISGTEMMTPDIPPNFDIFASTSPNVLLTYNKIYLVLRAFQERLYVDLAKFGYWILDYSMV